MSEAIDRTPNYTVHSVDIYDRGARDGGKSDYDENCSGSLILSVYSDTAGAARLYILSA